ncbi:MAG: L,D-transpeptidase [Pseudolabrys sp.]|nr:L,D-transpeptidase [Pseudolabrys sp.]
MRFPAALVAAAAIIAVITPARADLLIHIDKSTQQMTVSVDGEQRYVWPVSTGIAQYDTPDGIFKPFRMEKDHFSREWDDAPMPYSIFFTEKGHAIHGTNHKGLGHPASHGCVRLSVAHAALLWDLVKKHKMAHTTVVLTGTIPKEELPAVAERAKPRAVASALPRPNGDLRAPDDAQYSDDDDEAPIALPPRRVYRAPPRYYYYDDDGYYYIRPRGLIPFFPFYGR